MTLFHDFLLNRPTNLNETWNIITRMKVEENCRKKYLKSCIEIFLLTKNYFFLLCPSVRLFVHLSICPSICPSVHLNVLLSNYVLLSIYMKCVPLSILIKIIFSKLYIYNFLRCQKYQIVSCKYC